MMNTLQSIRRFLNYRFNLQEDRADEQVITDGIRKNVDFKGANLWALIFAIFIASIGLNVNSTAVIIGAMLISPIMGPVMGIGLGIGINDLDLVKKGLKNLFVASVIGILASTIYFLITPLHDAQSELLARTSPSIWDVFIACFGGMAGMVAATRKEKSNVIPGVAIATALMPPLCTAGFGIAMGNWYFFLGAIYLYFINSVFIAIAAFVITRYVKLKRHHFEDLATEKRVNRYIIAIVIITVLPSIFMAYRIVDKSIFETNARKFVAEQFNFNNTQVVSKSFAYSSRQKSIEILLIGAELDKHVLDTLNKKLERYGLKGVSLHVRQGLNAQQHIDLSQIKASILEDVFNQVPKEDTVHTVALNVSLQDSTVLKEMKVLYPQIRAYGLSKIVLQRADSLKADTQRIAVVGFQKRPSVSAIKTMQEWLQVRYKQKNIKVIIE